MNDAQKQVALWGGGLFLIIFLFPPYKEVYLDDTAYRFLFSKPNDAYEMSTGLWFFYMVIIIGSTVGGIYNVGGKS